MLLNKQNNTLWIKNIAQLKVDKIKKALLPHVKLQNCNFFLSSTFFWLQLCLQLTSRAGVLELGIRTRVLLEYHFLSTRTRTQNLRYSKNTHTRWVLYSVLV